MSNRPPNESLQKVTEKPKRSRGRPSVISREIVIEAALALMEEPGQNDLSVRSIARRLNTGKATLYNYFKSMDGIKEAVADKLIGELPWLDPKRPESLRSQLVELNMAFYQLTENCHAIVAQAGITPGNRAALNIFNSALVALVSAGIDVERAAITLRMLRDFTVAHSPAHWGTVGGVRALISADLELWKSDEVCALRDLAESPLLRLPYRDTIQASIELVIDRMLPELLE